MKKTILIGILSLVLCLAVGCTTAPAPASPTPGATTPAASPSQENSPTPSQGDESGKLSTEDQVLMESELGKLSEIQEAAVYGQNPTLLVGLTYDAAYQGGLNDRVRGMIEDAVKNVLPNFTEVLITDDPALVDEIRTLSSGSTPNEGDFDTLKERMQNSLPNSTGNMLPSTTDGGMMPSLPSLTMENPMDTPMGSPDPAMPQNN